MHCTALNFTELICTPTQHTLLNWTAIPCTNVKTRVQYIAVYCWTQHPHPKGTWGAKKEGCQSTYTEKLLMPLPYCTAVGHPLISQLVYKIPPLIGSYILYLKLEILSCYFYYSSSSAVYATRRVPPRILKQGGQRVLVKD